MEKNLQIRSTKTHAPGELNIVHVISDYKCLYECFNFLLFESKKSAAEVQEAAAKVIEKEEDLFSDVVLGASRKDYLIVLRQGKAWGGYIELVALAQAYQILILVYNQMTMKLDSYGNEQSEYAIYLYYSGSHYDAIVAVDACCERHWITLFDTSSVHDISEKVKILMQDSSKRAQTQSAMKCLTCEAVFTEKNGLSEHSRIKGHATYFSV